MYVVASRPRLPTFFVAAFFGFGMVLLFFSADFEIGLALDRGVLAVFGGDEGDAGAWVRAAATTTICSEVTN